MSKVPAYFTAAFGLDGALTIQQIQYREVMEVDGELVEVKQYPPDLITAPQPNDLITATIKDAVGAIAAGHLAAVRQANTERDEAVAHFEAADGANVEALRAEMAAKDAVAQTLLTQVDDLQRQLATATTAAAAHLEESLTLRHEVLTLRAQALGTEPPPPLAEWRAQFEGENEALRAAKPEG